MLLWPSFFCTLRDSVVLQKQGGHRKGLPAIGRVWVRSPLLLLAVRRDMRYNHDWKTQVLTKGDEFMEATLEKIRSLEQIYIAGYEDSFLDSALHKIISHQLSRDQADLKVLQQDLAELERKYGMRSEEFYERFQAGQMSDEADFMEWNVLYKMATKLQNRLDILQG
jgi:hypothetical protein